MVTTPNERTRPENGRSGGAHERTSSTNVRAAALRVLSRRGDIITIRRFSPLWPYGYLNLP